MFLEPQIRRQRSLYPMSWLSSEINFNNLLIERSVGMTLCVKGKEDSLLDRNSLTEASFCKEVFKQENGRTVYYTALPDLVQCYVYFFFKKKRL